MPLDIGTKLGAFEITGLLGRGGMGEVYRARDTKLGRDVAIKVLSDALSADAEMLARFEREALNLARLDHPNIGTLYEFRNEGELHYLVMQLVEGDTLERRIVQGALPPAEAIALFTDIAEALDAAHGAGVIHRDLKPANIKITPDDTVKVLDFGIAKSTEGRRAPGAPDSTPGRAVDPLAPTVPASPTPSSDLTGEGVFIGTPNYMSPEQMRGKPVDRRADIWAYGVCLYEALTGRMPFNGETISDVITSVLRDEPDWEFLPAHTPPRLRALLERCLEKHPKNRLRDIGDALYELARMDEPVTAGRTGRDSDARLYRFEIRLPTGMRLSTVPPGVILARDGGMMLLNVVQDGTRKVYLREMNELGLRPVPGTDGAFAPNFSWNNQWITFCIGNSLKKVALKGGSVQTVAEFPARVMGAYWMSEDCILVSLMNAGLLTVSPDGGSVTTVTELDAEQSELQHLSTSIYQDRNWVFASSYQGSEDRPIMIAASLDSHKRVLIRDTGTMPNYLPTGHLIWSEGETMYASPCSGNPPALTGRAVQILKNGGTDYNGRSVLASFSDNGTFVYAKPRQERATSRVCWVKRDGTRDEVPVPPGAYGIPRVSPDGELALISGRDENGRWQIYLYDFHRAVLETLTAGEHRNTLSMWMPDGNSFVYMTDIDGTEGMKIFSLDTQRATLLQKPEVPESPHSVSKDGKHVAYIKYLSDARQEIWIRTMDGEAVKFAAGTGRNTAPQFDSTGQYVAYVSDESRRWEVYVRPYGVPGRRIQVSNNGGLSPVWSADGTELFYSQLDGAMMSVPIERGPRFRAGQPRKLFEFPGVTNSTSAHASMFDIHPDGERFLMVELLGDTSGATELVVTLNWFEELNRLVPILKRD